MFKKDIKFIKLFFTGIMTSIAFIMMFSESFASPIIQIVPQKTEVFTDENSKSSEPVGILISDPEGGLVTLTCESSNKTLAPQSGFLINSLEKDKFAFTLLPFPAPSSYIFIQMKPAANQFGTSTISISLEDKNKFIQTVSFVLNVNGIPKISTIEDHTFSNLLESYDVELQIQDPETACEQLGITILSSDNEILPLDHISFSFLDQGPDARLTIYPLASQNGQVQIKILVSDQSAISERTFNLWIKDAPIIYIDEQQTISMNIKSDPLLLSICDSDGGHMTLTIISSDSDIVSNDQIMIQEVNSNQMNLDFTQGECKNLFFNVQPENNKTGITTLTIKINDGFFEESSEMKLSVINTAPEITYIPGQIINMNTSSEPIAFTISDTEGGNITMTCHSQNLISHGTCSSQEGGILTFTLGAGESQFFSEEIIPDSDVYGSTLITIDITDGLLSNSISFTLTVNSPPIMIPPDPVTINMNTISWPVPISIIDYDNDSSDLSLSLAHSCPTLFTNNSITYEFLEKSCTLFITPVTNQSGSCEISLNVNDGLAFDQSLLHIRVNQRPFLSSIASQQSDEDQIIEIPLNVSDDEPLNTLNWTFNFSNDDFINNTNVQVNYDNQKVNLILQSTAEVSGETSVTITVSDSNMFSYSQAFLWEVFPYDDPPEISGLLPDYQIEENTSLTLTISLIDPDTVIDDLNLTVKSSNIGIVSNDNIEIQGNGQQRSVFIIPGIDTNGETLITFRVFNTKNPNSETIYSIPLYVYPENNPPVIHSYKKSISEDSYYKHIITASDYENDPMQFEILTYPSNGRITYFNELSGELIYVPYPNFHGMEMITYVANDGIEYSEPGTLAITVTSKNDAPIAYDNHYVLIKNQPLTIDLLSSDVDTGDALIYRLTKTTQTNGSIKLTDFDEGIAEYVPLNNQTGEDQFWFYVRDMNGGRSNTATISIEIIENLIPQYTLTVNMNGEYQTGDAYEYAILDATDNHEVISGISIDDNFQLSLDQGSYRLIIIGDGYEPYEYMNKNSHLIRVSKDTIISCDDIIKKDDFHPNLPSVQVSKTLFHNGFFLRLEKKNFNDIFVMKINDKTVNIGNETWPYTYKWTAESSPSAVSASNHPYTGITFFEIPFEFYDWDEYVDSYTVTYYQFEKEKDKENFRSEDKIAFEESFGNGGAYGSKAMYETVGYDYFYPLIGTTIDLNLQAGTGSYSQAVIDIPRIPMEYLTIDDPKNWEYNEDKDYYDLIPGSQFKLSPSDRLKVEFSHYAFYMTIASGIAIDFFVAEGPHKGKKVRYNPYHFDNSSKKYIRFSEAPTIKLPILLNSNYNKFNSFSEALLDMMSTFPALIDEKGDGAFTETESGRKDRFKKEYMPFVLEKKIVVYLKSNHLTRFAALWSNPVDDNDTGSQYFHAESIDSGGCFIQSLFQK